MSISVIIPAYNASRFIAETLQSVLRQTLPPQEIIVIDDGSKDETAAIVEHFDPSVRLIRRTNAGQAASRNLGVQQATAEWIAFLDADDLWVSTKLERQMEELAHNPRADVCYTARKDFVEENGKRTLGATVSIPSAAMIHKALLRNTTFMPSSTLIRRSVFLAAGGFDTNFRIVEDWDLWLRLLHKETTFAACEEPLLLYRIHPESVSHKAIPALAEAKQIFRTHVLPDLPPSTRWLTHMKSQSGQEAAAAITLRRAGDPRHLRMMAVSILRYPFSSPHRFTILAHMLYMRLKGLQK